MRMSVASFPSALALTIVLLTGSLAHSETLVGTVVGLADGDTVTVLVTCPLPPYQSVGSPG